MSRMIYQPSGNAAEYAELACNIYKGCPHNCKYCYVPRTTHTKREVFENVFEPKEDFLQKLRSSLKLITKKKEFPIAPVLLSFISDPYQHIDKELELTRKAIKLLNAYSYPVRILTKGGDLVQRDFDVLSDFKENEFGITLTLLDENLQKEWEPFAASPKQRIENLRKAKSRGIKTWLSLEPIINLQEALNVIDETQFFTDFYGVGKLNYNKHQKTIDWKEVKEKIKKKLNYYGKKYMIHKSLEEA